MVPIPPSFQAPPSPLPNDGPEDAPRPRRLLTAALTRIDGWGPLAWREIHGWWDLGPCRLLIEPGEDPVEVSAVVAIRHRLGDGDPVAVADWVLRQAWAGWLGTPALRIATLRPDAAIRSTTACWLDGADLLWRGELRLPLRGMTVDAAPVRRWLRQLTAWGRDLTTARRRPGLALHLHTVAVARALRAALPKHGLCAFLAADSRLVPAGEPLRIPARLQVIIDCGRLGRHRGWGIPSGSTALVGAPYHGKSTVLAAIAAGHDDHPPGDGRERVVALSSALIPSDEGRRIITTDLSSWFTALPGSSRRFSSDRASGATSQAAGIEQAIAGGTPLLLIDEDTAAANALSLDPDMRALLGRDGTGTTTLSELLPAMTAAGLSVVTVVGSAAALAASASRIVRLHHFQPRDATAAARRQLGPAQAARPWRLPVRRLVDDPEAIFRLRNFVRVEGPADRPMINDRILDLRRCGWDLDPALLCGAIAAAAWVCRAADGQPSDLRTLGVALAAWLDQHGALALDPYGGQLLTRPPWALVVAVLERIGVAIEP